MPFLDLPFETFAELHVQGYEVRVTCLRCHQQVPIDITRPVLRDRHFAGARFRCQRTRYDGTPCEGLGMASIGKERRWTLTMAEHARRPRDRL